MKRHWAHSCRRPKHLTDLYQALMKAKRKEIEMKFIDGDGVDLTCYDIDFFGGLSEKNDHLINDENANIDCCYFIYQIIYYYVLYLHLIITFFLYIFIYIRPCCF